VRVGFFDYKLLIYHDVPPAIIPFFHSTTRKDIAHRKLYKLHDLMERATKVLSIICNGSLRRPAS